MGDVQVTSNIEAPRAVRLFEAWAEQRLSDGRLGLLVGVRDLNAEFYASEVSGLFIGAAHGIGTELAQTGLNGPSIFPITALSVRVDYVAPSGAYVRAAAFDGVAGDPERPARTSLRLTRHDGALLVAESGASVADDAWRKASVGVWRYTERFDRIDGGRPRFLWSVRPRRTRVEGRREHVCPHRLGQSGRASDRRRVGAGARRAAGARVGTTNLGWASPLPTTRRPT